MDLVSMGCTGAVFPAAPGTTVGLLRTLSDLDTAGRLGDLLAGSDDHLDLEGRRLAAVVVDQMCAMQPAARGRMVHSPLAPLLSGALPSDKSAVGKHARWAIGSADVDRFACILTPRELGDDGLYLPHHNATLHGLDGVVAARTREGEARFTWSDGVALTLPAGDIHLALHGDVQRFERHPAIFSIPVLNGVGEAERAFGGFGFVESPDLERSLRGLEAGLLLLHEVWPDAFYSVLRWVRAFVTLVSRDCSRSHSPAEAPGLVLLTIDGPEKVGDLLCHECSHLQLNAWRAYDPLLENADEGGFESPWRTDARPLIGLLLGVHAFAAVLRYYRRLQASRFRAPIWDEVIARQSANVRTAWSVVLRSAVPTAAGERILAALRAEVDEVTAE